ncbi:MAG: hypothetical protein ACI8R4_003591 [Paracoccaceae bacterium]|jgi:hypothetical protein
MLNVLNNLPEDPAELRQVSTLLAAEVKALTLKVEQHHDETHLCISLPFVHSFIANIARKRPELNRDKTRWPEARRRSPAGEEGRHPSSLQAGPPPCHRAPVRNFTIGRQRRIGIETPGTAFTKPGAGGRGSLAAVLKIGHINSHLLVGDGFAGQPGSPV